MERFALLGIMQNNKARYIQSHPILKKMPLNLGEKFILKGAGPRITGTITDNQDNTELGYIIDVPSFFTEWDMLTEEKRLKYIRKLLKILRAKEARVIIAPLLQKLFTKEEYEYCLDRGFILLDSFEIRLASQIEAVEKILTILQKKIHTMNAIIWRADTKLGEIWAEFLAPYFNYMLLGGEDRFRLDKLSEKIINKTGLACTISDKVEDIIEKSVEENYILIWTEKFDSILNDISKGLIIMSGSIDDKDYSQGWGAEKMLLEFGWLRFPYDISCNVELSPLEEISVLEGIFYLLSEVYRTIISRGRIDYRGVMDLRELFKLYPLSCQGFVSSNQFISYNSFRRMYFRNIWNQNLYSRFP